MFSLVRGAYKVCSRVPTLDKVSTDVDPTTNADGSLLANGTKLYEIDTGKIYRFDAENLQWRETTNVEDDK